MTDDQKQQVHKLRLQGVGYKAIAKNWLSALMPLKAIAIDSS